MKIVITIIGVGLLALFASHSCRAQALPDTAGQQDTRLERRITLRAPRILVGELLQRLSQQSGVTVTADLDSGAGDDEVVADFHDVPLADALNAVWSLFSYKAAVWEWRSVKAGSAYSYTLVRPASAKVLATHIQEQIQKDFTAQVQELISALDMPQDQLAEAAKQNKLLNSVVDDGRVRARMKAFISLPTQIQADILQGHTKVMRVSQLSTQGQAAIQEGWQWESDSLHKYAIANGIPLSSTQVTVPEVKAVGFFVSTDRDETTPNLFVDTGQGGGELCGGEWLDDTWRKKLGDLWVQPGDTAESTVGARTIPTPRTVGAEPRQGVSRVFTRRLLQMADAAPLSVLARLPDERRLRHVRQRCPALRPNHPGVPDHAPGRAGRAAQVAGRRPAVQLPVVQDLLGGRAGTLGGSPAAADGGGKRAGGFLPLSEIAHAAHVLTPAQMKQVGTWFGAISEAADWHDFLDYYDRSPEYQTRLRSPDGDSFRYPQDLLPASFGVEALRQTHPNLRLRLVEKYDQYDDMPALKAMHIPPVYRYLLQVLDGENGQVLTVQDINCSAHEYRESLLVEGGGWVRGG